MTNPNSISNSNSASFHLPPVALNGDDACHSGTSSGVDLPYELAPDDYLSFAEQDLLANSLSGNLNAIHNAKRAVGCALDSVLWNLGLSSKITKSFPTKLAVIRQMGLVSPRIVGKLVKSRNDLEHEYKRVEASQAEDAVDVATLFVSAVYPLRGHAMTSLNS
jgi:hypothetical protein